MKTNSEKLQTISDLIDRAYGQAGQRYRSGREAFLESAKINPTFAIENGKEIVKLQEIYVQVKQLKKGFEAQENDAFRITFLKEYLERFKSLLLSQVGESQWTCQYKNAVNATKMDASASFIRRISNKGLFVQIEEILSK
jgi:hypothetical protein